MSSMPNEVGNAVTDDGAAHQMLLGEETHSELSPGTEIEIRRKCEALSASRIAKSLLGVPWKTASLCRTAHC